MFLREDPKPKGEEKTNEEVSEEVIDKVNTLVSKHNWNPIKWSKDHTKSKEETGR